MIGLGETIGKSRRSPHGERGLKYVACGKMTVFLTSLPAWGAWIEIQSPTSWGGGNAVAPRMGSVD